MMNHVKKGDIVLITTAGGSPMGGKKLAEILEVYSDKPAKFPVIKVYVFAWKQEVSTLAMHITEISDGELAIHRLKGER